MKRIGLMILAIANVVLIAAFAILHYGPARQQQADIVYSVWLYTAQDPTYYSTYEENPVLNYLLKDQYAGKKIAFSFQVPATGQAQNNYQTMIAGGEFPDLMQSSVADAAPVMYANGYIQDITGLVKTWMPNYYSLIMSEQELHNAVVFTIDGEERILSINTIADRSQYVDFGGMCYRRDWIVKYGVHPETGAAFTGGFASGDVDDWTDDVMFPSWYDPAKREAALAIDPAWDGTEPFFISDWEWMFEIFTRAQADLGITDSYCVSMYYPGFTWAGGLCSCFGEGGIIWYADADNQVAFGGTSDSTRAYFTCLNNWYNKGWLDGDFNERVGDAFYMIDSAAIRQGKVGMWCGVKGDLGGRIDSGSGYTEGIFVSGCSYPVNDVYGDDSCRYIAPRVMNIDTSRVSTGFYVMSGSDQEDLIPLMVFLDQLYAGDGAVLRTLGLNAEQLQKADTAFYDAYGLSDGAYTMKDGVYTVNSAIIHDSGSLSVAASLDKLPGLSVVDHVDRGLSPSLERSLKAWIRYDNKGRIWGSTAMLNTSVADSDFAQNALTKVLNYMESNAYKFIKGEKDITSDKAWKDWCKALEKFNVKKVSDRLQPYLDQYPIAD